MPASPQSPFDPLAFLATTGLGRRVDQLRPKQTFFEQGDSCASVFYLQSGRAKLTLVSPAGKEATITLISANELLGEECIAAGAGARLARRQRSPPIKP
jgi:CRP/FNR family cyclic AMP-dependent transcriptional regulator